VNVAKCELWKVVLPYQNDHTLFGKHLFEILLSFNVFDSCTKNVRCS
jgi:hypothetical protein